MASCGDRDVILQNVKRDYESRTWRLGEFEMSLVRYHKKDKDGEAGILDVFCSSQDE